MSEYLQYLLDGLVYTITDAVVIGLAIAILIRIVMWLTPLKSLDKIKENSTAMLVIVTTILLIFGAYTIIMYFVPEVV